MVCVLLVEHAHGAWRIANDAVIFAPMRLKGVLAIEMQGEIALTESDIAASKPDLTFFFRLVGGSSLRKERLTLRAKNAGLPLAHRENNLVQ
jgi:hypothetical protein